MPETRAERIVFGIGILAIAALVALIVLEMTTDRFERHPTPAALPPTTTATTTTEAAAPPAGANDRGDNDRGDDAGARAGPGPRNRRQVDVEGDRRHLGRRTRWLGSTGTGSTRGSFRKEP